MSRSIEKIVNEQVLRWQMGKQSSKALQPRAPPPPPIAMTIAHSIGSNGAAIAERVATKLSLPLFDREIVRHIADSARVRMQTVDTLDEKALGRFEEYLTSLLRERGFHRRDFLRHLTETVLALWQHGPCIMVGHGCVHIVPRRNAMPVRMVAPASFRAQTLATREDIDLEQARTRVWQVDAERARFHRVNFAADIEDPLRYDLMLDTTRYGVEGASAVLAHAFEARFHAELATTRGGNSLAAQA